MAKKAKGNNMNKLEPKEVVAAVAAVVELLLLRISHNLYAKFRAEIGHFAPGHSTGRAKPGHFGTYLGRFGT